MSIVDQAPRALQSKAITHRRLVPLTGNDFYPTPHWAVKALLEKESFAGPVWEPACGKGDIVHVLQNHGLDVWATDIEERGFEDQVCDFLKSDFRCANIITNPPFNLANRFVLKALELATEKVAMLMKLSFFEGRQRYEKIFAKQPPNAALVFSSRITFFKSDDLKNLTEMSGGTAAHAWFVWDMKNPVAPHGGTITTHIPPNRQDIHDPCMTFNL